MARDRGPQPQPSPPDDDPTFGTSWGPNGSDTRALRKQMQDGGGGGEGTSCALIGFLISAGLAAVTAVGAKYGVA